MNISLTHDEYRNLLMLVAVADGAADAVADMPKAAVDAVWKFYGDPAVRIRQVVTDMQKVFGTEGRYRCDHCGEKSHKRLWGPGWMTCPLCKKQARTTAERRSDALSQAGDP